MNPGGMQSEVAHRLRSGRVSRGFSIVCAPHGASLLANERRHLIDGRMVGMVVEEA